MQIRRHRRGRGHGVWQPEMERKLRALGESAQQQQNKGREVQRVIAHLLAGSKHMIEVVAAHNVADDQHAPQQAQAARAGDGERHARAAPRIAPVVPVADQQERKQAGQFPEERQLNDVARQHHARHRTHEGQKKREEARHRIGGRHVIACIQHHQRADAQHQHAEHPRKAIHADDQVQAQSGQPFNFLAQHAAVGDLGKVKRGLNSAEKRNQPCDRGLGVTGIRGQYRRKEAADERKKNEGDQGHAPKILRNDRLSFLKRPCRPGFCLLHPAKQKARCSGLGARVGCLFFRSARGGCGRCRGGGGGRRLESAAIHPHALGRKFASTGFAHAAHPLDEIVPVLERTVFALFDDFSGEAGPDAFDAVQFCGRGLVHIDRCKRGSGIQHDKGGQYFFQHG